MSNPNPKRPQKQHYRMKPEVEKIFNDLDAWLNHCRFNLIKYDPADLYKSYAYKDWQEKRRRRERRQNQEGDGARPNHHGKPRYYNRNPR